MHLTLNLQARHYRNINYYNFNIFDFYDNPYFNYVLYSNRLQKFLINLLIYGTKEGPHMWPKRLPFFLFLPIFISNSDNFNRRK